MVGDQWLLSTLVHILFSASALHLSIYTALQFIFREQTIASVGMAPQFKDEPKGSGREGL